MRKFINGLLLICIMLAIMISPFSSASAVAELKSDEQSYNDNTVSEATDSSYTDYEEVSSAESVVADGVLADGIYYIKNNSTNQYLYATYESIKKNTCGTLPTRYTAEPYSTLYIWKVHHLGDNLYSIRPLCKLDVCLSTGGMAMAMTADTNDTASTIKAVSKWLIQETSTGYTLKSYVYQTYLSSNSSGSVTLEASAAKWSFEEATIQSAGVLLYDTQQWLAPKSSIQVVAAVYSDVVIDQRVTWTSSNTSVATVDSNGVITGVSEGTAVITAKSVRTVGTESFTIHIGPIANGIYFIKNKHSGKVVDVYGSSLSENASISQYQFYGDNLQMWIFELQQDGYYTIQSVKSSYYLSVLNNSANSNATVTQLSGGSASGQLWKIVTTSSGAYRIYAKCSPNGALSLASVSTDEGVLIKHNTYTNNTSYEDEWYLHHYHTDSLLAYNDGAPYRNTYMSSVKSLLQENLSSDVQTIFSSSFTTTDIKDILDYTEIFVIHTHGTKATIKLSSSLDMSMNDFNGLDLSNVKLILLLTCKNGVDFDESHITNNAPVNIVEKLTCLGAETVIGFNIDTDVSDCNNFAVDFMSRLLEKDMNVTAAINDINYKTYRYDMGIAAKIGGNKTLKLK